MASTTNVLSFFTRSMCLCCQLLKKKGSLIPLSMKKNSSEVSLSSEISLVHICLKSRKFSSSDMISPVLQPSKRTRRTFGKGGLSLRNRSLLKPAITSGSLWSTMVLIVIFTQGKLYLKEIVMTSILDLGSILFNFSFYLP